MESIDKKEKFLRELRKYIYVKFGNQKQAAKLLKLSPPYLSSILSGSRPVPDAFRKELVKWGFPAKYFILLAEERAERRKRKDEFLLILEQKDDIILSYKQSLKFQSETYNRLLREAEEWRREAIYWRKKVDPNLQKSRDQTHQLRGDYGKPEFKPNNEET